MKQKSFALLLTVLLPSFVLAAPSASGIATIPLWQGYYASVHDQQLSTITVSNITGSTVSVTITLYSHDGTVVSDDGSGTTGFVRYLSPSSTISSSYDDSISTGTVSFDIGAHETATVFLQFSSATGDWGYGTIQWTAAAGPGIKALVAHMRNNRTVATSGVSVSENDVMVNGGLPF